MSSPGASHRKEGNGTEEEISAETQLPRRTRPSDGRGGVIHPVVTVERSLVPVATTRSRQEQPPSFVSDTAGAYTTNDHRKKSCGSDAPAASFNERNQESGDQTIPAVIAFSSCEGQQKQDGLDDDDLVGSLLSPENDKKPSSVTTNDFSLAENQDEEAAVPPELGKRVSISDADGSNQNEARCAGAAGMTETTTQQETTQQYAGPPQAAGARQRNSNRRRTTATFSTAEPGAQHIRGINADDNDDGSLVYSLFHNSADDTNADGRVRGEQQGEQQEVLAEDSPVIAEAYAVLGDDQTAIPATPIEIIPATPIEAIEEQKSRRRTLLLCWLTVIVLVTALVVVLLVFVGFSSSSKDDSENLNSTQQGTFQETKTPTALPSTLPPSFSEPPTPVPDPTRTPQVPTQTPSWTPSMAPTRAPTSAPTSTQVPTSTPSSLPSSAPTIFTQLVAKLTASDAAPLDYFGISLAISGDTAVVGAYLDDDGGTDSGSAYVFSRNGTTWSQQAKLTASDAAANDWFGYSVAISGDTAIVGALYDDNGGSNSGSAYVFARTGTAWSQQAKLTASDAAANDEFGYSVSISGNTAIVGAYQDDDAGSNSGSAYVFFRTGTAWRQQAKLTASDAAAYDQFGYSVAVSGDTAIVGADGNDEGGSGSGSAYVFFRTGMTWTEQAKLTASDAAADDQFGYSVAMSGDTAIVSARRDNHDGGSYSGSVYVFFRTGTAWSQQAKLTASDAAAYDYFGSSVSISGDTAIVGSALDDNGEATSSGSAYIFSRTGTTWSQQTKLTASDAAGYDLFGSSVAISGDTVIVGALNDDDGGASSGSAYVFDI